MNVIFLDVDGVLNTHKYTAKTRDEKDHTYKHLEKEKLVLLKQIVEKTESKLVLSSTWKLSFNDSLVPTDYLGFSLAEALSNDGLSLYGKTSDLKGERYDEIKNWLEKHPEVDRFVILDDHNFGWNELQAYWVKTSFYVGLTEQLADLAIEKLNE